MSESASFVHLQVHTQYSLLEGAIRIPALIERAKELGMPAIAITDANNLYGAIDFYLAAKKAGIKPIIGCELFFVAENRKTAYAVNPTITRSVSAIRPKYHRILALCQSKKGYQNLCEILTHAYTDAADPKRGESAGPRALVDRELLAKFSEGLIILNGNLRSDLAYHSFQKEEEEFNDSVSWFQKIFGENFYFALEDNSIPEQTQLNQLLYKVGKEKGIECVATNNCHYMEIEDAEAQEVLQCIGVGKNLDFDRPDSLVPSEFYFKSAEKMFENFQNMPGVCENSIKIADKCNLEFKFEDSEGKQIYHLPQFRPEGIKKSDEFDLIEYFKTESAKGLETRFQEPEFSEKKNISNWEEKKKEYYSRLEEETEMIIRTGFTGYFLIVADFINWAKTNDIPVGPGRGSGAGSLVAYSLRITDLDPIEFNLLFERFINPERISMPDFDVDFCQDRRGEVIEYVQKKYGVENVCQIITFGKLQARAVIKDVARVLGLTFAESDRITKLLPDELNIKIKSALEKEPQLRELMESDARIAKVIDYALKLEGLSRNAGVHAAGVIITEEPVVTYSPLFKGSEGSVVTQFDKDFSEKIGLVKFDFLGLKTLTVIDKTIKLIRETSDEGSIEKEFVINKISYKDKKVFALVSSGDTNGVFQVESSGMKDLCTRLQPSSVEDLTAINALYRPGPLGSGMVDDFIDRKHGRKPIEYDVDMLAPILKDTYGVILYQEQVMQIARELAGYSLGQADMLRRAMGKKKADEMTRHREIFMKGAKERGLPEEKAEGIYDLMAKFAEYGFNKSHSAAYAVLTYQTAFLKAYYPAEFMAALMTTEINNTDKITKYINDARSHDILVLPPDVNASNQQFGVEVLQPESSDYPKIHSSGKPIKAIRFGLEAIKGVGGAAVDTIIEARKTEKFKDVLDFCKRVSTRKANKKVMEALTFAGAFDRIAETNRASLFASLEKLIEHASDEQAERELGQSSLFDAFSAEEIKLVTPANAIFQNIADWPLSKKLIQEKQVVGFFVSGHPMDYWQKICEDWLGWNTEAMKVFAEEKSKKPKESSSQEFNGRYVRPKRKEIQIAGLLTESKEIITKKGTRMAFTQMEDLKGKIEVIFFPDTFAQYQDQIRQIVAEAEPVILTGEIETRDEQVKLFAKKIETAKEAHRGRAKEVILHVNSVEISVDQLRELKKVLIQHRGNCPVVIKFDAPGFRTQMRLPQAIRVDGTPHLAGAVRQLFGKDLIEFR